MVFQNADLLKKEIEGLKIQTFTVLVSFLLNSQYIALKQ